MLFLVDLAGTIITVDCIFESTESFLNDYITESSGSAFSVHVNQDDISYEREKYIREAELEGVPIYDYSDNYLETLALYRKIVRELAFYDTILFHGSVVAVDGIAYLFTAKSGTGKSTHTRLWRGLFGERAEMINDDKPLIHVGDNDVTVYGTPWDGKHHLSTNTSAPLKAICIIERGKTNTIERIGFDEAYPLFLQQTYQPQDGEALLRTLESLDKLMNRVKIYRLQCNMDIEAAEVAYNGMQEDNENEVK